MQRIEELAKKVNLSRADRDYIAQLSKELGLPFTPRPRCSSCYSDQAVIIYKALKEDSKEDSREYILKEGVDVIFMGKRINNETLTDSLAESLLAEGFAKYLFAKCK